MRDGWRNATKADPCPICEGQDWCAIGETTVVCRRIESERPTKGGGWLHKLTGNEVLIDRPRRPKPKKITDAELHARWMPILHASWIDRHPRLHELADELGVADWSLDSLLVGWDGSQYLIPTLNHRGLVIGLDTRWLDGTKMVLPDSRRGLVYASNWRDYPGPIIVVEGPSDTAAALTMHLCVIGRPNNLGGVEQLVRMLGGVVRPIIVIAERDRKRHEDLADVVRKQHDPTCKGCLRCWPGLAGARKTADSLWKRLNRRVDWAFMPDGMKDTRCWLQSKKVNPENATACRKLGESLLRRLERVKGVAA